MNLFTSSSKVFKHRIATSVVVTGCLLCLYQVLVTTKVIVSSAGMNQWQGNFIKIQKYAYQQQPKPKVVIVGSSLASNFAEFSDIVDYFNDNIINLALRGGCSQTGLEAVRRHPIKPSILAIEMNYTTIATMDKSIVESIYDPFLYALRDRFSMFRQEYQPLGAIIATLRNYPKLPPQALAKTEHDKNSLKHPQPIKGKLRKKARSTVPVNPKVTELVDRLVFQRVEAGKIPLTPPEKLILKQQADLIKWQIAEIKQYGVRVVLFDIPEESRVEQTLRTKQIKALMKELFPIDKFEWLIEPPLRNWTTSDGLHLAPNDARDYAAFFKQQLLGED
jgi:hypothetical protein